MNKDVIIEIAFNTIKENVDNDNFGCFDDFVKGIISVTYALINKIENS